MHTWKLTVAYDGRHLCGWQAQHGVRTVQVELERALRVLFDGENIVVHGSGRTDSGVHALGQVASFRAERVRGPDQVRLALNALLPADVSCVKAELAPDGFHARFWATGKTYRYLIREGDARSPFWEGRAMRLKHRIDWDAYDAALACFRGTHDFTAFQGPPSGPPRRTERTIERCERTVLDSPLGTVHATTFDGPGFLRYQIRIMVGTALEVGIGKRQLDTIPALLARGKQGVRDDAGRTAPPDGLYLVEVRHRAEAPWAHAPRQDAAGGDAAGGDAAEDADDGA